MKLHKLASIGLAALLLTAGAAMAMPGDAPDHSNSDASDAADEHADERDENATAAEDDDVDADETEEAEMSENESAEDRDANAADAGPPTDMPEQVPDHVSQIHDLIRQFLNGDGDGSLGDQISDVTANENATDAGADEQPDQNAADG